MNALNLPARLLARVTYSPHLYQPLKALLVNKCLTQNLLKRIMRNHLLTQRKLNAPELVIGELGDLSRQTRLDIVQNQLHLLQRLDVPALFWELDVNYDSDLHENEQDCYAWNGERMSVTDGCAPNALGELLFRHARFQMKTRRVAVCWRLSGSPFANLRGEPLRRVLGSEGAEIAYRHCFAAGDLNALRLDALQAGAAIQVVLEFAFATHPLRPGGARVAFNGDVAEVFVWHLYVIFTS